MRNIAKIRNGLLMIALVFGMSVTAQQQQQQQASDKESRFEKIVQMLELSEEQQSKIKDIRTKQKQEMLPLRTQMKEKKAHLISLQTAETVDMNAVYNTIDEIGNLKTTMSKSKALKHDEIRKLLTPEQRTKFDSHFIERCERRQGKKGEGKSEGQGHKGCNHNH